MTAWSDAASPPARRALTLALSVLAACTAWPLPAGAWPTLPSLPNPFSPKSPLPLPAPAPPASDISLLHTRSAPELRLLFAKGNVDGTDLIPELAAIRALMNQLRSPAAVGSFLGTSDAATPADSGFDPAAFGLKKALEYVDGKVKPYSASIGIEDLDAFLGVMVSDPQRLVNEKISLPDPKALTDRRLQRIATMAAIVVATRITGRVLKKAKEDFAGIEGDYLSLIERREKVATLLYGVLLSGVAGATELNGIYADDDLRFLRDNVARMSVNEFANDMGAQNLALRYLQKIDPGAYQDYKARADGALGSTRGYIRTVAGGAAFAALLVAFVQQSADAMQARQFAEMSAAVPLMLRFLSELPPVVEAAWAAGAAGIVELPMKGNRRFRLVTEGGGTVEVSHSADVFAAMKKQADAEAIFTGALFRRGGDGLLYKLYRCDRAEAGRLIDAAVPTAGRDSFAREYIAKDAERYSFVNGFTAPGDSVRERELGDELLREDQRRVAVRREIGELQRAVVAGYDRWGDDPLLRMVFANREGVAAQATLQLGDLRIRPIPSAQSLYAYESLIDGCGQQFGGGAGAGKGPLPTPIGKPVAAKPRQP